MLKSDLWGALGDALLVLCAFLAIVLAMAVTG